VSPDTVIKTETELEPRTVLDRDVRSPLHTLGGCPVWKYLPNATKVQVIQLTHCKFLTCGEINLCSFDRPVYRWSRAVGWLCASVCLCSCVSFGGV